MAVPRAIGTHEALLFYSGSPSAFEEHSSTLEALGAAVHLGEDPGLASLHDVALLTMMWSVLNGFLHGAALLGAAGVSASALAPLAAQTAATTATWLAGEAEQVDREAYPADDATLRTHLSSLEHLLQETRAAGVDDALPALFIQMVERAVADGRGGEGYSVLIEHLRGR